MRLQFLGKVFLIISFMSFFTMKAPLTDDRGVIGIPTVPYSKRFKTLRTVPSYPSDKRFALVERPSWRHSYKDQGVSPYYPSYDEEGDDADSTAGEKTSLDDDELDDGDTSVSSDTGILQKGSNQIVYLESMYSSLKPNDFVNSLELQDLIDGFELQTKATKVRLILLGQVFLGDFVKNDGWGLGDKFKKSVLTLVDKLNGKLSADGWKIADEAKNLVLPAGVMGVTFQGRRMSASRSIWGVYNDDLYEAFVTHRLAHNAFFNVWRAYTTLSVMTVEYLETAVAVLSKEILMGMEYCLAKYVLVDGMIKDLQDIIEAKAHSGSEEENSLTDHLSDAPDGSIMAQSIEFLQEKSDQLLNIKNDLSGVIKVSDASPLQREGIASAIKNIDALLSSLEKGLISIDLVSDKQFSVSSFLLLSRSLKELLLRAGAIMMSKKDLADWTKDVLARTLFLINSCLKHKSQLKGATGCAAAFFEAYDLTAFIECLVISNPALKDLLMFAKDSYPVLKRQYGVWSKIVSTKPAVTAKDFVYVQPLVLDVYDKKPADYDDPVSVLALCFPLYQKV